MEGQGPSVPENSRLNHDFEQSYLRMYPTCRSLLNVWIAVDTDGDGFLGQAEVKILCKRLNVQWTTGQLWKEAAEIARREGKNLASTWDDSSIDFPLFVQIYQQLMGVERRTARSDVKATFERLDVDRTGGITKEQTARLVKALRKMLRLLPPEFDLDVDWANMMTEQNVELLGATAAGSFNLTALSKLASTDTLTDASVTEQPTRSLVAEEVTFDTFEAWWKSRMGLIEADTPVLPEFFAHRLMQVASLTTPRGEKEAMAVARDKKVATGGSGSTIGVQNAQSAPSSMAARASLHKRPSADVSAGAEVEPLQLQPADSNSSPSGKQYQSRQMLQHQRTGRSGKHLWRFLIPRLRLLTKMKQEWGALHNVYGHNESVYGDPALAWSIRDPDSTFSVVWDLLQIVLLLYVSITVPFRACFEIEIPLFSFTWWFDSTTDLYFISDMILAFRTAYVNAKGIRESRPKVIAQNYLKGWFVIDFFSCIPVGHIATLLEPSAQELATDALARNLAQAAAGSQGGTVLLESSSNSNNLRALKALRLVRLSKMLRLARLKRIMQKYENLMVLQQYMGLIVMLCVIVFTAHFLTCIWFAVGNSDQDLSSSSTPSGIGGYVPVLDGTDPSAYDYRGGATPTTGRLAGWVKQQAWATSSTDT